MGTRCALDVHALIFLLPKFCVQGHHRPFTLSLYLALVFFIVYKVVVLIWKSPRDVERGKTGFAG